MVMDNQVCVQIYLSHREVNQASGDKKIQLQVNNHNFLLWRQSFYVDCLYAHFLSSFELECFRN